MVLRVLLRTVLVVFSTAAIQIPTMPVLYPTTPNQQGTSPNPFTNNWNNPTPPTSGNPNTYPWNYTPQPSGNPFTFPWNYTPQPSNGYCNIQYNIMPEMNPGFGSLGAFYSIARGIMDGVQGGLSQKIIREIDSFMMGYGEYNFDDVQSDVVSQAGYWVMAGVGGLIWLLSVAIFIGVAIFHCCCCCCKDKRPMKHQGSKILLLGYIITLIVSFIFILVGFIIFEQSVSKTYSAMDNGRDNAKQIAWNARGVGARRSEMFCVVNATIGKGLSQAQTQVLGYPDTVINDYMQISGQTGMSMIDWDNTNSAWSSSDQTNRAAEKSLSSLLNDIRFAGTQYQNELLSQSQLNSQIQSTLTALKTAINNAKYQTQQTLQVTSVKTYQNKQTMMATAVPSAATIGSALWSVQNTVESMAGVADVMIYRIINYANTIASGSETAFTWSGYTPVKSAARASVAIPATLAFLFIVVLTPVLIYRFLTSTRPQDRSHLSHALGHFSMLGFYIIIVLTSMILLASVALFWFSYGFASVCVPVFQDNQYSFLNQLSDNAANIPGVSSGMYGVQYSDFMRSISQGTAQTCYGACQGQNMMNSDQIKSATQIDRAQYSATTAVQQSDWYYSVDQTSLNYLSAQQQNLQQLYQRMLNIQTSTGFLPVCSSARPDLTATTVAQLNQLTSFLSQLNSLTLQAQFAIQTASDNVNTGITNQLVNDNLAYFSRTSNTITDSSNDLVQQLLSNAYRVGDLLKDYVNTGHILCDQYARPLNGMWASAGLASLFFIPLALVLLFASNWLYRPEVRMTNVQTNTVFVESVGVQQMQAAQPVIVVAQPPPGAVPVVPVVAVPGSNVVMLEQQPTVVTSIYPTLN